MDKLNLNGTLISMTLSKTEAWAAIDRGLEDRGEVPFSDVQKDWLVELEYVRDIQAGEPDAVQQAVEAILHQRSMFGAPRKGGDRVGRARKTFHPSPNAKTRYEIAVSNVLAWHADNDPKGRLDVASFRRDVLGGRPLSAADVVKWVRGRAANEKPPTRNGGLLAYADGGDTWTRYQPTRAGGVLNRLRRLSVGLAEFYGWEQAQATIFVLADMIPYVPAVEDRVLRKYPLSVRSRILLTIDPKTTPQEVSDYYRRVRRDEFGRVRRLGERHTNRAVLGIKRLRADRRLNQDDLDTWNSHCSKKRKKEWCYDSVGRFARECEQAAKRLLEGLA